MKTRSVHDEDTLVQYEYDDGIAVAAVAAAESESDIETVRGSRSDG